MSSHELPSKMRALMLESTSTPPQIRTIDTPQPTAGSAIVRVVAASVISYMREVYNGARQYNLPIPFVPGTAFIGRLAATGPDTTKLKIGDLVFVDSLIGSRDDPDDQGLAGLHYGHTAGSKKLMESTWRNWSFAEYCSVPLENIHLLDERRLCGSPTDDGLGYSIPELSFIANISVPYGGLRDIELRPGQTIIVAPATGPFGGAAVVAALAMGARVIAMGRNRDALHRIKELFAGRVETVPITGDMQTDHNELKKFGRIDAYYDIGPREASESTHLKSAILALRRGGRVSLMGGYKDDMPFPHNFIMHRNIRLYGKWMYERSDIEDLIKLAETGTLKLGKAAGSLVVGEFPLEEWKQAWDCAWDNNRMGQLTLIKP
ncbi:alcohol dehydrogenase [Polychaeton citri CBS 116435]|uniref:Alcohol dehydrogenase n=1 Tax=Polychaeton citri CBS 116435 TaxID=1314669 RepID=A0A9P4UST2_9PEZI|nr:alcohol dehydrogenase [Polychaeton citri CBS 116435]